MKVQTKMLLQKYLEKDIGTYQINLSGGRIVGNVVREIIATQRLPTNRVIMQRTMRMSKRNRTTVNEFSLKLYEEILPIW